ncbi:hypothetical protein HDU93_009319 [Gonapodya sp. JEL0774]|nr:hypothetical protein HDU93_009319 [Gonapodya sp. JEL0774]
MTQSLGPSEGANGRLIDSVERGYINVVQQAIRDGADVNGARKRVTLNITLDYLGVRTDSQLMETPLCLAIRSGKVDLVQALLSAGADPNLGVHWLTAYHHSVWTLADWENERWFDHESRRYESHLDFALVAGVWDFSLPGPNVVLSNPSHRDQVRERFTLTPSAEIISLLLQHGAHVTVKTVELARAVAAGQDRWGAKFEPKPEPLAVIVEYARQRGNLGLVDLPDDGTMAKLVAAAANSGSAQLANGVHHFDGADLSSQHSSSAYENNNVDFAGYGHPDYSSASQMFSNQPGDNGSHQPSDFNLSSPFAVSSGGPSPLGEAKHPILIPPTQSDKSAAGLAEKLDEIRRLLESRVTIPPSHGPSDGMLVDSDYDEPPVSISSIAAHLHNTSSRLDSLESHQQHLAEALHSRLDAVYNAAEHAARKVDDMASAKTEVEPNVAGMFRAVEGHLRAVQARNAETTEATRKEFQEVHTKIDALIESHIRAQAAAKRVDGVVGPVHPSADFLSDFSSKVVALIAEMNLGGDPRQRVETHNHLETVSEQLNKQGETVARVLESLEAHGKIATELSRRMEGLAEKFDTGVALRLEAAHGMSHRNDSTSDLNELSTAIFLSTQVAESHVRIIDEQRGALEDRDRKLESLQQTVLNLQGRIASLEKQKLEQEVQASQASERRHVEHLESKLACERDESKTARKEVNDMAKAVEFLKQQLAVRASPRSSILLASAPLPVRKVFKVRNAYEPRESDEIRLSIGDQVFCLFQYPDGWAAGTNKTPPVQSGVFPLSCLTDVIDDNDSLHSEGTLVNFTHIAATPLGQRVTATATLVSHEKRTLNFEVEIRDETEIVGRGTHTRAIVDSNKFMERVNKKAPESKA